MEQITNINPPGDKLSVGLHVALLEVGSEAVQVLVVRKQGVALSAVEVGVPDAQHGQDHWHVLVQRGSLKNGKGVVGS